MPVIPNYSLYTAEVFIAAARAIISESESLGVLEDTSRKGKSQCMWVAFISKSVALLSQQFILFPE